MTNQTGVSGPTVIEYAPRGSVPICIYSSGLSNPIYVTTDDEGNVYVSDFWLYTGYLDKYKQLPEHDR